MEFCRESGHLFKCATKGKYNIYINVWRNLNSKGSVLLWRHSCLYNLGTFFRGSMGILPARVLSLTLFSIDLFWGKEIHSFSCLISFYQREQFLHLVISLHLLFIQIILLLQIRYFIMCVVDVPDFNWYDWNLFCCLCVLFWGQLIFLIKFLFANDCFLFLVFFYLKLRAKFMLWLCCFLFYMF